MFSEIKVINYIYLFSVMYLTPIDLQELVKFSIIVCHLLSSLVALPKGYQKLTFVKKSSFYESSWKSSFCKSIIVKSQLLLLL